jgi:hypothetical protein
VRSNAALLVQIVVCPTAAARSGATGAAVRRLFGIPGDRARHVAGHARPDDLPADVGNGGWVNPLESAGDQEQEQRPQRSQANGKKNE